MPAIRPALVPAPLAALAVAAVIGGVAYASAGGARAGQPPVAPSPLRPRFTPIEQKYYGSAWSATVARDPACDGSHGHTFTTGSPSHALTSRFAVLRQPATPAPRLPTLRYHNLRPQPLAGGEVVYDQELYLNQIRLARSAFGARFYVIPAGNVSVQRDVPARCAAEQIASLGRLLTRLSRPERARILVAQARFLGYLRYLALHSEGICASYFPAGVAKLDLADDLPTCATLADFRRWGVLVDASVYLDHAAVFWTVVPDGVAEVTLRFTPRGTPPRRTVTTTVRPVNNIVVAREPLRAPYESGIPSTIVLRDARGRALKKISVTSDMPTLAYGC